MKRTASDRMAECIIEMVHEYKQTIEELNKKIDRLNTICDSARNEIDYQNKQLGFLTEKREEVADIIAGFTEHTDDGYIKVYLSNLTPENATKLERLFKLLNIPMTAEQIKEGDTIDED